MSMFFTILLYATLGTILLQMLFFIQHYFSFKQTAIGYYAMFLTINFIYLLIVNRKFIYLPFLSSIDWMASYLIILSPLAYYYFFKQFLNLQNTNTALNKTIKILINYSFILIGVVTIFLILKIDTGYVLFVQSILLIPIYIYILLKIIKFKLPYIKFLNLGIISVVVGSSIAALISLCRLYFNLPFSHLSTFFPILFGMLFDVLFCSKAILAKQ